MTERALTERQRRTLELFDDPAPLTTNEVAERLDLGRRSTYERLDRLVDGGWLETKKVGASARVWWRPLSTSVAARSVGGPSRSEAIEALVETVDEYATFTLDPEGHVRTWDPGAERLKGYEAEEIIGEHVSTFYTEEDREAGVPGENLAAAAEDGSTEDEGWRVRADGSRFWATVTITAIRDDDGNLEGYAKVTRDMTDRRERELRLREEHDLNRQILETAPAGIFVLDRDGEVVMANDRFRDQVGVEDVSGELSVGDIDLYDESGSLVPPEERPYWTCFELGETVTDWQCRAELPSGDRRWASVSAAPITADDGDEVERAVIAVRDITRLREQTRQLERQRDDLESELDEVFDRIDDAFFALDEGWRFSYVNDRAADLLDRPAGELVGREIWGAFPDAVGTEFQDQYERAFDTQESVTFEEFYEPLDAWFEVSAYPSESGLSVYFREVTERKEREYELERYETIVETIEDGVYVLDEEFRFVEVNDAYVEMTGYDREELLGAHATLVVDEDVSDESAERLEEIIERGDGSSAIEADIHRADGSRIRAESRFTALRSEDGERTRKVGVVRDVTERVERERELEEAQRQFRTIVDNFPNGAVALVDEDLRYATFGGTPEGETDLTSEDLEGELLREVLPESIADVVIPRYEAALDGESATFEDTVDDHVYQFHFVPVRDDDGDVFAAVAMSQAVTERKRRERELERYETIAETIEDGIYAIDGDARFVLVNEGFCELTGYDREELLGAPATTVYDEGRTPEVESMTNEIVAGEREFARIELDIETKDDDAVPCETRFATFPVGDGHGRCGVVRDITERKRHEETLTTLYDSAHELLEAESTEAVSEAVVETVTEVLDLPGVVTYEYNDRDGKLHPTARSIDPAFMREEFLPDKFPVVSPDDSTLTGHVYTTGETKLLDNVTESPYLGARATETRSSIFTPMGSHGVLVVGSLEVGAFDERTRRLVELLATNARSAYDRVERERQLEERVRQQESISRLGRNALETSDLDDLFDETVERIAETLDADYCKVLDLDADADRLFLRSGVGWEDGYVGEATVGTDSESQAGYTLMSDEPVVVEDVATETRFTGPDLLRDHDVASGISATIGPAHNPWGVLGVHDTECREFRPNDAFFVQTVATILGTAIERRERERALESQRERLAALNNLNEVVREVTDAAVEQSTRDEIEETVCRHLADSESYLFAWIGDVDPATQRVRYRAEAGTGDYLDGTVISVDPDDERSEGPSGLAFRTGEIQTTHDVHEDPRFEPWRDHIRQYDFRSSASIPIVHEGTVYGTLNVYAERPDAFEGAERAVVGQLGEVVGHAIAAAERKQALMSDEVVELEFHIPNVFDALGVDATPAGRITLHHTISIGDDKFVVYGTADDDAVADMRAIAGALPHWDEITFRDGSDGREFELVLSEPPVLSVIASVGGSVDRAVIEDGDYRLTIATSPHVNVRRIIDTVKDTYSAARLVRREQVSRSEGSTEQVHRTLMNDLTDRQRTALEAAYHGGFFKWPRDASGEDIASTLGVSAPTFHQHLRKAERKVFDRLFSTTSPATSGPVEA